MDRIEFLCPSGHQLHGPITLAGRAGQCPHCGMRFRIPSLEELQAAAQDTGIEEMAYEQPAEEQPLEEQAMEEVAVEEGEVYAEEFVEEVAEEPMEEFVELAAPAEETLEEFVEEYVEEYIEEVPAGDPAFGFFDGAEEAPADDGSGYAEEPVEPASASGPHPMAELFAELWRHKAEGASVELHLGSNETVHAEHYAPALSRRGLGVFAVRDAGGSFTLTAIAWDLINRVSVRGVRELPAGLFE